MRIENTRLIEHLGSVKIHGVRRILELDSGTSISTNLDEGLETQTIGPEEVEDVEQRLAIILPIKNENLKVFAGVLAGIPHNCLVIVISNSQRGEIDEFKSEQDILSQFCSSTKRQALIIHQKDPFLSKALENANYPDIIGEDGLIRDGKSEGMILGILLAMVYEKDYIGFIDTDNYIPGAVWEYVKHYAIGFNLAKSPFGMTRILWRYKPKMLGELYFKKWGRVSEVTNRHINQFISAKGKFESEIIKTANAGEHAMSLELAKRLTYATGYGVETQELVSIIEQFGGILPISDKNVAEKGVDIIQTETINPHLHEERGGEHLLQEMLLPSLSVIYHSQLSEPSNRKMILNQLIELECLQPDEEVPKIRMISPPQKANIESLTQSLEAQLPIYYVPKGEILLGKGIVTDRKREGVELKRVVFTDLEGTLLHPLTKSYTQALDALRLLQEKGVPIIFCADKTRAEQELYREELDIKDPFIVENGGAIFIPRGYFRFPFTYDKATQDYFIIEFGIPYREIRYKLRRLQEEAKNQIVAFGDMSLEEIARDTSLNLRLAGYIKQREYSEIVKIQCKIKDRPALLNRIKQLGLNCNLSGSSAEIMAGNDKGKAVQILTALYKLNFGDTLTAGIGVNENHTDMLAAVNLPILVQESTNRWRKVKVRDIWRVRGVGPEGWDRAIKELVAKQLKQDTK